MVVIDAIEQRVLGSLIEKELSTPEYYPLTLNALVAACNQKSNRDPVMQLSEAQVRGGVEGLIAKDLAWQRFSPGSRVAKFAHKFSDTLSKVIEFNTLELAVVAELLLRGPQTLGELRSRVVRMAQAAGPEDIERILNGLMRRQDGPFVAELSRHPGQREGRYAHLFGGERPIGDVAAAPVVQSRGATSDLAARLTSVESELSNLKDEMSVIKAQLAALSPDKVE